MNNRDFYKLGISLTEPIRRTQGSESKSLSKLRRYGSSMVFRNDAIKQSKKLNSPRCYRMRSIIDSYSFGMPGQSQTIFSFGTIAVKDEASGRNESTCFRSSERRANTVSDSTNTTSKNTRSTDSGNTKSISSARLCQTSLVSKNAMRKLESTTVFTSRDSRNLRARRLRERQCP
jgi:hypothetical protein